MSANLIAAINLGLLIGDAIATVVLVAWIAWALLDN